MGAAVDITFVGLRPITSSNLQTTSLVRKALQSAPFGDPPAAGLFSTLRSAAHELSRPPALFIPVLWDHRLRADPGQPRGRGDLRLTQGSTFGGIKSVRSFSCLGQGTTISTWKTRCVLLGIGTGESPQELHRSASVLPLGITLGESTRRCGAGA